MAGAAVGLVAPVITSAAGVQAAGAVIEVTTSADVVDPDDGAISLREAFDLANADPGDDVISLVAEPYEYTIGTEDAAQEDANLAGDLDHVAGAGALTIHGNGHVLHPIDSRAIEQHDPALLAIDDLAVVDAGEVRCCDFAVSGGAIRAVGDVTLDDVGLRNSGGSGGGPLEVSSGGGLSAGGLATIRDSYLNDNRAGYGGAVSADSLLMEDTVVSGNHAGSGYGGGGGGLSIQGTTIIRRSFLADNETTYGGGALTSGGPVTTIEATTITRNEAHATRDRAAVGGGLLVRGRLELVDSWVRANSADGDGGGIAGDVVRLTDSKVSSNTSADYHSHGGGGIFADTVLARRSTIAGNHLTWTHHNYSVGRDGGAGIWGGEVRLVDSTVSANVAERDSDAGGVYAARSLSVVNSTISGNAVTGRGAGGGIRTARGAPVLLSHATVVRNSAPIASNVDAGGLLDSDRSVIAERYGRGSDCRVRGGARSGGYNVVGGTSCGLAGVGDLPGVRDAGLGPLVDNRGPTETHRPRVGTVLSRIPLDHCGRAADQRGFTRPAGARCEAGSVEVGRREGPDGGG